MSSRRMCLMSMAVCLLGVCLYAAAEVRSAEIIAETGFEDPPASDADDFAALGPPPANELGYQVTSGPGGAGADDFAVIAGGITGQSYRMRDTTTTSTLTFDTVDISAFQDIEFSIDVDVLGATYEADDFYSIDLLLDDGMNPPTTSNVFDSTGTDLDTLEGPIFTHTFSLPDGFNFVTAIANFKGEGTAEGILLDNLFFEGTPRPEVPEPSTWVLFALAGLGMVGIHYWRRRQHIATA